MNDPLDNMESANGQLEYDRATLEEIFGVKKTNVFGTTDFEAFKEQLNYMAYVDMQKLAGRLGLESFASAPRLRQILIKAFQSENKDKTDLLPKTAAKGNDFDRNNPEHLKVMRELGMRV